MGGEGEGVCSNKDETAVLGCHCSDGLGLHMFWPYRGINALAIGFPEGDPGLYVGKLGPLWEFCNKFKLPGWGKCGDIDL